MNWNIERQQRTAAANGINDASTLIPIVCERAEMNAKTTTTSAQNAICRANLRPSTGEKNGDNSTNSTRPSAQKRTARTATAPTKITATRNIFIPASGEEGGVTKSAKWNKTATWASKRERESERQSKSKRGRENAKQNAYIKNINKSTSFAFKDTFYILLCVVILHELSEWVSERACI